MQFKFITFQLLIIPILFNLLSFEPVPLNPNASSNQSTAEEVVWNIKDEFPHLTIRNPDKEKKCVIRILDYSWTINDGEHIGNYIKECATIFDTAKRNKPYKVKPNTYLILECDKEIKTITVEYWEGQFLKLQSKDNKIFMPNKVGKFPIRITIKYDSGTISYGILIQSQK